ncbi:oxidoreductase-like protein family [Lentithecium fluviatile CBS 122367]|uniref:Oxidoreductase-like protein family n=1 Tax=Lentithecium fluviatile CBS 122367 TaxID=1168545 RepID=A0A6G1IU17_9PLEO|nr:oxidoreductase-like protein family [Lentithecium fluviatile CBS 122367]
MPTNIALIGSGIFAKEEHLPAILATPLLTLKAVYSRTRKSAEALAADVPAVDLFSEDGASSAAGSERKYEDLLRREDIQGVIIALPILAQPDFIKAALKAGKHVLAEKPVAKDVATAQSLLAWISTLTSSSSPSNPPTFSVAENFRFLPSFLHASSQIASLGRILSFRTKIQNMVAPGGKYYETAWRKTPEYQGGFLLDGGVHFIAATRLLLEGGGGGGVKMSRVAAFTCQLQEHLPPVDTVDATVQLSNGASGTLSISFGTTLKGSEYAVACEKGTVVVSRGRVVTTTVDGVESVEEFPDEGNGVKQEVEAWGEALQSGERNERQSGEEALKDLMVLEALLRSGEAGGKVVELEV